MPKLKPHIEASRKNGALRKVSKKTKGKKKQPKALPCKDPVATFFIKEDNGGYGDACKLKIHTTFLPRMHHGWYEDEYNTYFRIICEAGRPEIPPFDKFKCSWAKSEAQLKEAERHHRAKHRQEWHDKCHIRTKKVLLASHKYNDVGKLKGLMELIKEGPAKVEFIGSK